MNRFLRILIPVSCSTFILGALLHCGDAQSNSSDTLSLFSKTSLKTSVPLFQYIASADFGIRNDSVGKGWFTAPRGNYDFGHTGIDFLMPQRTPLFSYCEGEFLSGYESGYGNWVQLVCLMPNEVLSSPTPVYISALYGHLSSRRNTGGYWMKVQKGELLGYSGRTGNAYNTNPHVHFEVSPFKNVDDAKAFLHPGYQGEATTAFALSVLEQLKLDCLTPQSFSSKRNFMLGNRIDPFVFLSCTSKNKPAFQDPSESLQAAGTHRWSADYSALFNVDEGQKLLP